MRTLFKQKMEKHLIFKSSQLKKQLGTKRREDIGQLILLLI
jgi:hypothetical protein